MPYFLLRFALGAVVSAFVFASAWGDLLENPMAILVCKNGVSTDDFEDLRFPLGQVQLILAKKVHCARGRFSQPDEAWWTARFKIIGTDTGGDGLAFDLGGTAPEQIFIHAETLSIVAIRRGQESSTREAVRIGIDSGQLHAKRIQVPPLADGHPAEPIPYWGSDSSAPARRSLSPLLGDELPLRLIDSPWLEIADGLLLDVRNGATRHYKTEQSAGLHRMRVLGLGPDVRTLLSLAITEDLLGIRLVLMDIIEGSAQVIPLDPREFGVARLWNGLPDTSAITTAWILRHFEVVMRPKGLQLHPRPTRPASPRPSFVFDNDVAIGLVCVRSAIVPVIIQALQRDWNADFEQQPLSRDNDAHVGVTCARDNTGMISGFEKTWYETVGAADVALSFYEDGRVSLTLLERTRVDGQSDDFSRARNALARPSFEAIGQYLNDRLREPEWQAQLIDP
jgi:hypothetical protein